MGPRVVGEVNYLNLLKTENTFATSSVVIRKSFLYKRGLEFNCTTEYRAVEDYDLWLRVLRSGGTAVVLPKILGANIEVRDHLGGGELFFNNMQHLIQDHSEWARQYGVSRFPSQKELLAFLFVRRAMELLRESQLKNAFKLLNKGLTYSWIGFWGYFSLRIRQRLLVTYPN